MNRIRELRKSKKLTLKKLGNEINLTAGAISKYELNQREPEQETLIKLAEFFKVSIDSWTIDKESIVEFSIVKVSKLSRLISKSVI